MDSGMSLADVLFQSTLPMRGETAGVYYHQDEIIISIHSPHAGRDPSLSTPPTGTVAFQSTLPMRGETFGAQRGD